MEQIEHVVLVMMENRDDINGLGRGPLPVNRHFGDDPGDPGVQPWPLDDVQLDFLDPPHEFLEVRQQWHNGAMDGFVASYEGFHAGAAPPTSPNVSPRLGTAPPARQGRLVGHGPVDPGGLARAARAERERPVRSGRTWRSRSPRPHSSTPWASCNS